MASMTRKAFLQTVFGATAASSVAACRGASTTKEASAPASAPPAAAKPATAAPGRTDKLVQRVFDNTISTYVIGAAYIGDRLGLFKAMAGAGAMSGSSGREDALRFKVRQRVAPGHGHVGLRGLPRGAGHVRAAGGPRPGAGGRGFAGLPRRALRGRRPGHPDDSHGDSRHSERQAIPDGRYPAETFDSIERGTRPDYLHQLVQTWLPAVPGVVDCLHAGGAAADLGSGAGLASIAIARAFPKARAFGYEPYAPSVARAKQNAQAFGVADRATFQTFDGVRIPGGPERSHDDQLLASPDRPASRWN